MALRGDLSGPWVDDLGYDRVPGALVSRDSPQIDLHPFAPELRAIMNPDRGVGASAVLCLDRVPTICLVDQRSLSVDRELRCVEIRTFCERLWNQNLARVVMVAGPESLEAWSVDDPKAEPERYDLSNREQVSETWSVTGLVVGRALASRGGWFDAHKRVDKMLLDNIMALVETLVASGIEPASARRLVARIIFITYLEDREIVGESYRSIRGVRPLIEVIGDCDRTGLRRLVHALRADFNGDFLTSADRELGWEALAPRAFSAVLDFLKHTSLRTGQQSFWRYDFSQIPIELIASIYETFLATKDRDDEQPGASGAKRKQGAYYTPRMLADWVIDLALADRDPLRERIFDGACGSGMLLTAAYRRVIRAAEIRRARDPKLPPVDFEARKALLLRHIFGADIDEDACQLTAFSLYLALLSDLDPSDLAELRKGGHQLPGLKNNIRRGAQGDFFSIDAEAADRARYSIFLSNPPWRELTRSDQAFGAMRDWQDRQLDPKPHVPKNQIAAGFALGAADRLEAGGRAALILPVNLFVSADPTQRQFRAHLLGRFAIERIINFSDMRRLIFADAVHPFVVLIARARSPQDRFPDIQGEQFEYWTPKTELSLAFGRLTVHGGDRSELAADALISSEAELAIRYWGSEADVNLLQRLRRRGRIRDLTAVGWLDSKGFHAHDNDRRRSPESWYVPVPPWMSDRPFLHAKQLPRTLPIVPVDALQPLPFEQIARVPPARIFEGPRVLWTDGAHPEDGVRAVYADAPFSFQHSLAVLSAPATPEGRLTARFLTAYLRSPMGLWLLLLLSGSVASERPKLHVREAMDWPFWSLKHHPDPDDARRIMSKVDQLLRTVEQEHALLKGPTWDALQAEVNRLVYAYFRLSEAEIGMIEELARTTGSAIQPTSLRHQALMDPMRDAPSAAAMATYCERLADTLTSWRDATGGKGQVSASAWTGRTIPIGAAVLSLGQGSGIDRLGDDSLLDALGASLSQTGSNSIDAALTMPELVLVEGQRIYLVKPLISRFWQERNAVEDANRLALELQGLARAKAIA